MQENNLIPDKAGPCKRGSALFDSCLICANFLKSIPEIVETIFWYMILAEIDVDCYTSFVLLKKSVY